MNKNYPNSECRLIKKPFYIKMRISAKKKLFLAAAATKINKFIKQKIILNSKKFGLKFDLIVMKIDFNSIT
jgi:hypothetical protein